MAKDYKTKQPMKNRSIQEELDNEDKEKGFGEDLEQAQYKRSL